MKTQTNKVTFGDKVTNWDGSARIDVAIDGNSEGTITVLVSQIHGTEYEVCLDNGKSKWFRALTAAKDWAKGNATACLCDDGFCGE